MGGHRLFALPLLAFKSGAAFEADCICPTSYRFGGVRRGRAGAPIHLRTVAHLAGRNAIFASERPQRDRAETDREATEAYPKGKLVNR